MTGRGRCSVLVVIAGLLLANLLAATAARAQPARLPLEMRMAVCIACHGREGAVSGDNYFPRLAGKPARYLYNQLLSFRDGRRHSGDMTYLVRNMSDAYLLEMAEYFAALDLPYPPVARTNDASNEMLVRGRALALHGDPQRDIPACISCHGAALTGVQPGIPALAGLPRIYLSAQLGSWLTHERHALAPDCMAQVGARLSTADVNAVASWIALQPMPVDSKPLPRLPAPMPIACGTQP